LCWPFPDFVLFLGGDFNCPGIDWHTSNHHFANASLQNIVDHFAVPLTKAVVDLTVLEEEWLDMVYYAETYLNLVQDDSYTVWWKLANCANSKKLENILALVELMLCLPTVCQMGILNKSFLP